MSDISKIKQQIADENIEFLKLQSVDLFGKKVLDVGFGLGYNSNAMRNLGAIVYGVEPDKEAFDYAVSNGLIDQDKAFNCKLQNIPDNLIGAFDVVTVFLYCIPFLEREEFASILAKMVKQDGIVVIGIADDIFITGDQYIEPVSSSIWRSFEIVSSVRTNFTNKCFLLAENPMVLQKGQLHT